MILPLAPTFAAPFVRILSLPQWLRSFPTSLFPALLPILAAAVQSLTAFFVGSLVSPFPAAPVLAGPVLRLPPDLALFALASQSPPSPPFHSFPLRFAPLALFLVQSLLPTSIAPLSLLVLQAAVADHTNRPPLRQPGSHAHSRSEPCPLLVPQGSSPSAVLEVFVRFVAEPPQPLVVLVLQHHRIVHIY